jgi:hypothetical protein
LCGFHQGSVQSCAMLAPFPANARQSM